MGKYITEMQSDLDKCRGHVKLKIADLQLNENGLTLLKNIIYTHVCAELYVRGHRLNLCFKDLKEECEKRAIVGVIATLHYLKSKVMHDIKE